MVNWKSNSRKMYEGGIYMDETQSDRGKTTGKNPLQVMGMSGMSGFGKEPVFAADNVWPTNFKPLYAHYTHIQGGEQRSRGCLFCKKGMDSLAPIVPDEIPRDGVHGGSRADEEESPASPSGNWE